MSLKTLHSRILQAAHISLTPYRRIDWIRDSRESKKLVCFCYKICLISRQQGRLPVQHRHLRHLRHRQPLRLVNDDMRRCHCLLLQVHQPARPRTCHSMSRFLLPSLLSVRYRTILLFFTNIRFPFMCWEQTPTSPRSLPWTSTSVRWRRRSRCRDAGGKAVSCEKVGQPLLIRLCTTRSMAFFLPVRYSLYVLCCINPYFFQDLAPFIACLCVLLTTPLFSPLRLAGLCGYALPILPFTLC